MVVVANTSAPSTARATAPDANGFGFAVRSQRRREHAAIRLGTRLIELHSGRFDNLLGASKKIADSKLSVDEIKNFCELIDHIVGKEDQADTSKEVQSGS